MTPEMLLRRVAVAEAVTWALLLVGMILKHGVGSTELGVRIFGMAHGVAFVAYCITTVAVAIDRRWSPARLGVGLLSAVPPFATLAFERYAVAHGAPAARWRLVAEAPGACPERIVAWLVRHPGRGLLAGLVGVGVLAGSALAMGPPVG